MFSFVDKCSLGISFGCKCDRSKLDLGDMWTMDVQYSYNRKTHKVHRETRVNPNRNLHLGDPVTVYWESGKKKAIANPPGSSTAPNPVSYDTDTISYTPEACFFNPTFFNE